VSWNYTGPRLHDYTTPVSTEQYVTIFVIAMVVFVSFLFRRNTVVGIIWGFIKMIITVMVLTLLGNFIKKEIKTWWNKD
jgi:hypothetical protein